MSKVQIITIVTAVAFAAPWAAADTKTLSDDPEIIPDESWISVSGTVIGATDNTFTLDYGGGSILVEMDDFGWEEFDQDYEFIDGHKVTVYGKIDDDAFESAKIEASSVYDRTLNSYFYANAADEEDSLYAWRFFDTAEDDAGMTIRGTVTKVNGREFTLDRGLREVIVDTDKMTYNPMDDEGYQKIEVGDRVCIGGTIDDDLFEKRELKADWIVTLRENKS